MDQARTEYAEGEAEECCHDYGARSETFKNVGPEVAIPEIEQGSVTGTIHDVVTVTAGIPANTKTEIGFELFLKPEPGQLKYDENWEAFVNADGFLCVVT